MACAPAASLPAGERGSKPGHYNAGQTAAARRSPQGSADRNHNVGEKPTCTAGRSPQGSADRNPNTGKPPLRLKVAPRRGARIETRTCVARCCPAAGRSPQGSADRNYVGAHGLRQDVGRSPQGSADRNHLRSRAPAPIARRSPQGSADRNIPAVRI